MTGTARVPPAPLTVEQAETLRPYRLPGGTIIPLFAALAHSPGALGDLRRATKACLAETDLSVRHREIVILRVCALTGAEPEWAVHVALFAGQAGLGPAELAATLAPTTESRCWTPRETMLLGAVEQLCEHLTIDDDLWQRLSAVWTSRQLVELLTVTAQYHKVAMLTNAFRLPVPEGLPRFRDHTTPEFRND
ncbi:carboxymuconolactone decarboxylase family protein [Amycolatopsis sulphurea]|uniref:Carboxymuconolactone decarboxylase family protein n=1 Tax=Amycolatopsis sulphurea TaxID=76022 RepID=A0A2A9FJV0_9PSEU|nr:carboxymuconolactone decarboxylase family protein [Amycolatopsis sulphurea]PFG50729.1 carboxymuconolactone decarboxylase family protein [Amycolatopsis sulphurea]